MNRKKVGVPLADPRFLGRLFAIVENDLPQLGEIQEILTRPYLSLSREMDEAGLQEGTSARSRLRSVELAERLIDGTGKLRLQTLSENGYLLGPLAYLDTPSRTHLYRALNALQSDERLQAKLTAITAPSGNLRSEQLVRDALGLSRDVQVDDAVTRRAVLSAWLTPLRQNIGSCFATAPAILVQGEQPLQFLTDLEELLTTGRLKRTFGGVEYAVPLSHSSGVGDLLRPLSLSDTARLAHSPGLQAALAAAGLLPPRLNKRQSLRRTEAILDSCQRQLPRPVSSAADLLRLALYADLGISASDVAGFRERISSAVPGYPVGGLSAKMAEFNKRYSLATAAFTGLTDNPLLKAWEFTIASFSDVKADFSRWNLYVSLGMEADEPGGIGQAVQRFLQGRLDRFNREIEDFNARYEIAFSAAKALEARAQSASEEEMRWLRAEHQQKIGEVNALARERELVHMRGSRLAHLFRDMASLYNRLFPDYFQEIFDPEMHTVDPKLFDDSPAGFRLLYKHGRANTALWTLIYTADEFIQTLSDFFIATEGALIADADLKPLEWEVGQLITEVISHIRTEGFLASAFQRAAARHRSLSQMETKPWAYISGGTMVNLTSVYFSREEKPTLAERVVESPEDLLIFLIDTLKEIPAHETQAFLDDPMHSMLMQSPTHGFLLKPGFDPFVRAWTDSGNTSTWIRRHLVRPSQAVLETWRLDESMMRLILAQLETRLPKDLQPSFREAFRRLPMMQSSIRDFRSFIVDTLSYLPWVKGDLTPEVDAILFQSLPFIRPEHVQKTVIDLLNQLFPDQEEIRVRAIKAFDDASRKGGPVSSLRLQEMVHSLILMATRSTQWDEDLPWKVRTIMRNLGLALPAPLLVADTNWTGAFFAFVVNPGTSELDFWRVDYLGAQGSPLPDWKQWLDGSHAVPWALYTHRHEYLAQKPLS